MENPFLKKMQYNRFSLEAKKKEIQYKGEWIAWLDNPSIELQLIAVRRDPSAIGAIVDPPLEVQLEAVMKNGYSIKYIENPSVEVQILAHKLEIHSIEYVINPCIELQWWHVMNGGRLIGLNNPDKEVQEWYWKNRTPEMID